jgi:outer membrane protein OmpA-like peptidoglycan-associated protein
MLFGVLAAGLTLSLYCCSSCNRATAPSGLSGGTAAGSDPLSKTAGSQGAAASRGNNNPMAASPEGSTPPAEVETIPDFLLAGSSPAVPDTPAPIESVAATGDRAHDWALQYERTVGGPEADLVVRTGDINNLGFGWPEGFDPFSGESTPVHPWPTAQEREARHMPVDEPPGTDRIMVGSGVRPIFSVLQKTQDVRTVTGAGAPRERQAVYRVVKPAPGSPHNAPPGDGYSGAMLRHCPWAQEMNPSELILSFELRKCASERQATTPAPILLPIGTFRFEIQAVLFQAFVDDFQAPHFHSHFQVSLNGTRIPSFEAAINSLDQTGPIGKVISLNLLPEYWPLLQSGTVKLLIDDPTTHVPDGYAIDFVRVLVNPYGLKYQVSIQASVIDADKHTPIAGARVAAALATATTDHEGHCALRGLPAGLVTAMASAPGYDQDSVTVDLAAGQTGRAEFRLKPHEEGTAALEKSIAETGSAAVYGIHFDTDSAKLRADSSPSLSAILGLINNHPGSRWVIAGHTDSQGDAAHNQTLSEARAASVVDWLKAHTVAGDRLVSQGFGPSRPVAENATANGRALNRRVEVSLAK